MPTAFLVAVDLEAAFLVVVDLPTAFLVAVDLEAAFLVVDTFDVTLISALGWDGFLAISYYFVSYPAGKTSITWIEDGFKILTAFGFSI